MARSSSVKSVLLARGSSQSKDGVGVFDDDDDDDEAWRDSAIVLGDRNEKARGRAHRRIAGRSIVYSLGLSGRFV